jgi:hypothetical protein
MSKKYFQDRINNKTINKINKQLSPDTKIKQDKNKKIINKNKIFKFNKSK